MQRPVRRALFRHRSAMFGLAQKIEIHTAIGLGDRLEIEQAIAALGSVGWPPPLLGALFEFSLIDQQHQTALGHR